MKAETIFAEALQKSDAAERAGFLDLACVGNSVLRAYVEELLAAHEQAGAFLSVGGAGPYAATVTSPRITESPGTVIGPYKLLEQIGEGGFGVVFMAEQTAPVKRKVALKVIKPGMDTRQVIARFEAERQALALMDHPNIARILDAGTTGQGPGTNIHHPECDEGRHSRAKSQENSLIPPPSALGPATGRPYFVMELVRGVPITEYCDQQRLPTRDRLALFVDVCHAVQHAHQKGIIHRDLKPCNVLVTIQDGRPLVKVIDFGIAKAMGQQLTDRTLFTGFAQLIGTPLYMSPEQAALSAVDVDTRSDVYSLGVLLYELLTGTTPFGQESLSNASYDELRRIIREDEPPRPSARISTLAEATRSTIASRQQVEPQSLGRQLRGELDWIVMRALEKDRNRRYETANSLVADVQRYLNDEAVQACPPSVWYRFRKLARRNRALFITVSVITVALLVAVSTLAVGSVLVWRAKADLQEALKREQIDSYFHRIALAHRELSENNLGRALGLLDECPSELRDWEWHYLLRLCQVDPLTLHGRGQGIRGVAFSPDGKRLASANEDGTIGLFDQESGAELPSLIGHTGKVRSLAFHPQGARLASTSADRTVKVWDLITGQAIFSLEGNSGVHGAANGVAFSPDGRLLAAGSERGRVLLCSAMDGRVLQRLGPHEAFAISMAFSPDSRLLATGSWTGVLRIWDTESGQLLHEIEGDGRALSSMSFRPDGRRLATAGYDRQVRLWDPATGELLHSWRGHDCIILGVTFSSPDGSRLATIGGEDKTVKLWDAQTGREVLKLGGHTYFGGGVVFSHDGRRLASSDRDGTIRIWDASPTDRGQELLTLRHDDEVWSVAFSPDGQRIASASFDQTARLWDAASGALLHTLSHPSQVYQVAFSRDGRSLASVGRDKTARIWDPTNGERVSSFTTPNEHLYGVTFSPDGRFLLVDDVGGQPIPANGHHAIAVWYARAAESAPRVVGIVARHREDIWCLKFSPDGQRLVSASNDGSVKFWRWDAEHAGEPQESVLTLAVRNYGWGDCVAFTPDGQRLVTVGGHNVRIWDVSTGDELGTLSGHTGDVVAVAVSPDGRWIASAGEDTTISLWDAATRERQHTLRGHTGMVMSLSFSPDSQRLVSGSRDKSVRVWDVNRWNKGPDR